MLSYQQNRHESCDATAKLLLHGPPQICHSYLLLFLSTLHREWCFASLPNYCFHHQNRSHPPPPPLATLLNSPPTLRQAAGPVQAVHACPQLGDYFVAVLASGGVAFYQGGLKRVAHCDAAGGGDDGGGSAVNARPKAVWSGVRGNKVLVLENIGAATDRVTTFALAVGGGASEQPSSSNSSSSRRSKATSGGGSAGGPVSASVTLVSSHLLTKPSRAAAGTGQHEAEAGEGEAEASPSASACSAAFLGRDDTIAGGGGGRSVIAVAWRTSSGPVWTKVVVGAGGAAEEFARTTETSGSGSRDACDGNGNGAAVSALPSNGHGTPKSSKSKLKKSAAGGAHRLAVVSGGRGSVAAGWARVPAIAAADGGRLLVHGGGGGGGGASPRLAVWDVTYGVLLEDGVAPEVSIDGSGGGGGGPPPSSSVERQARAVGMKVSGDGAHLALAVAGRVIVCPVPVKAAGTLASLLRRKRPAPSCVPGGGSLSAGGMAFPSVDLAGSAAASKLLEQTGTLEAGDWEAGVVTPFRAAEAAVVRSLRDAARRKDGGAFERILLEHVQQRAAAAAGERPSGGEASGDGAVSVRGNGRKKRRRDGPAAGGDYSAGIVAAAVELCLSNPGAKLWGALAVLVRSGGVSARHHRGLVAAIVEHASAELLEEVSRNAVACGAAAKRSCSQRQASGCWLIWSSAS